MDADRPHRCVTRAVLRQRDRRTVAHAISRLPSSTAPPRVGRLDLADVAPTRPDGQPVGARPGVVHHRGLLTRRTSRSSTASGVTAPRAARRGRRRSPTSSRPRVVVNALMHVGLIEHAGSSRDVAHDCSTGRSPSTTDLVAALAITRIESVGETRDRVPVLDAATCRAPSPSTRSTTSAANVVARRGLRLARARRVPRVRRQDRSTSGTAAGRDAGGVPDAREASRGADLPADRTGSASASAGPTSTERRSPRRGSGRSSARRRQAA